MSHDTIHAHYVHAGFTRLHCIDHDVRCCVCAYRLLLAFHPQLVYITAKICFTTITIIEMSSASFAELVIMLLFTLLLCAAVLQHSVLCEEVTTCKCVGPADHKVCPDSDCHPLMYYAENFTSDTVFKFVPGNHVLNGVHISATGLHNLIMVGCNEPLNAAEQSPLATVQCIGNHTGFLFESIVNLSVITLGFENCGFSYYGNNHEEYNQAVLMKDVTHLRVSGVLIYNSAGYGLYIINLCGNSSIDRTIIGKSHNTTECFAGNLHMIYNDNETSGSYFLNICNSKFIYGTNVYSKGSKPYASGIGIFLVTTNRIHITLRNVTMTGNKARNGGNLAISYVHLSQSNTWLSSVTIDNCTLSWGSALLGGGIYMSIVARQKHSTNSNRTVTVAIVNIINTIIEHNEAYDVGAGAYIQLYEEEALSTVALINISYSVFSNNTVQHLPNGRGGVALSILNFQLPGYMPHRMPQYNIYVTSCNFTYNRVSVSSSDSVGSGTLFVEENAITELRDNVFLHNGCTGIVAVRSNLVLKGNTTISNNTAMSGGGMVLCDNSLIYLSGTVTVNITQNTVSGFGGGIYAEFDCTQAIPPCFFQAENNSFEDKTIYLDRNSANKSGSALYGGSIDYCFFFGQYNYRQSSTSIFLTLFNITHDSNDSSYITSNPLRVCFCYVNGLSPNCRELEMTYDIYPGSKLEVPLVVVGQRNGPVPGVVVATNVAAESATQSIKQNSCKNLSYSLDPKGNVSFYEGNVSISLTVQNTDFRDVNDSVRSVTITVRFKTCPLGFQLPDVCRADSQCGCTCLAKLKNVLEGITCSIRGTHIHKKSKSFWWLGIISKTENETEIAFNKFCPFDFCDVKVSHNINVHQPESANIQCAFNRSGILCGGCKPKLSKVFGSSHCVDCMSHYSVLRALGLVLAFTTSGILLVLFLGVLDMTVTEGTLNAIIFYMNVVSVNRSTFFGPPKGGNTVPMKVLKVFVSWMNLDLGHDVCFYNGMNAIEKTVFQFLFPLYLWFLAGLIIYLCRKSSLVSKMVGENAVKLLATIILLSYAKLLRTIIDAVNLTTISFSGGSYMAVWTMDGNITFLGEEHAFLFAFALIVAAVSLPYTLALLFIQCLRKRSNMKVLFWVNKLKPFFDAYTGPYKDKYHFWTGFLLIIRISLFVVIALKTSKGPILNLTLIGVTTSLLSLLIQPGIYRKWPLTAIEAFTHFNLTVYSIGTAYVLTLHYSKEKGTLICIGSMFLLFCGVVVYHVYKKLSDTQRWRKVKVWLLQRRWPWMKQKPIRSLILHINPDIGDELSSSDSELDPILHNAPPVARYDEYREPLIETENAYTIQ